MSYETYFSSKVVHIDSFDVSTVDGDATLGAVIVSEQKLDDSTFAAA